MSCNLVSRKNLERFPLQIAFLGGGINSAIGRTHKIAAEMDGRFKLVAGCFSRQPLVNAQTARCYGVDDSRVYGNIEEMLSAEQGCLDAVVILTPIHQHVAAVSACLQAGIPVICEKALASSSEHVNLVKDLLDDNKGFLAITYNYTGYPMVREMRSLVRDGYFGRLLQVQVEMPQESFLSLDSDGKPRMPQAWRLKDEGISTVSLDLGTHLHSIVRFITDQKPEQVVGQSNSNGYFNDVVDTVSSMVQYSSGMQGNFWYTKAALGSRNGLKIRIFGDQASAEWLQENPECVMVADNKNGRRILDRACKGLKEASFERYNRFKAGHPAGFIEAFANYYWDLAEALHEHLKGMVLTSPYVLGVSEAIEAAYLFEAIEESSRERRWVNVSSDLVRLCEA